MSLTGQVTSIFDRTNQLIELYEALKVENARLMQENRMLLSAADLGKVKANELEEKLKAVKLARSLEGISVKEISSDEKTLDIKQKISDFVREIDKCIVLLKK